MRVTDTSDLWWKTAVVYCLDVETYMDWNGDGCGDLEGLAHRLDYLAELGVTCIWLMPFYPSPDRDDGYDITDYYGVDARLGHHGDLVEVIRTAKDRGMRVIADLVVNHTSDQHPWFVSARSSRESPFRDFYVWADEPPAKQPEPVFPDQEDSLWEYDKKTKQYYLHNFYKHQPDLNVANPRVREEIAKVIGFWMELGISGFRVDAVPFFIEQPGFEGPHDYLRSLRSYIGRRSGEGVLLGEVNLPYEDQLKYFGGLDADDELTMQFDFVGMQQIYLSLAREDATPLADTLAARPALPEVAQWANFLRNHDELTLDKLTEDERQEVFDAFAPEERMQVYGRGIVRRLPPMLHGDPRRIRMAYSLLFSLPGTPVLFYGEEIGMGENLDLPGRTSVRSPMQWTSGANGGFSKADPEDLVAPVTGDGFAPSHVNASQQRHDEGSLLNFIRLLIQCYRNSPEIGWGRFTVLEQPDRAVLAHQIENGQGRLVALHNFAPEPATVRLELEDVEPGTVVTSLLDADEYTWPEEGPFEQPLDGYGYRWLRVIRPGDQRLT
ncbi:alpha-amylase family protein [Lysobacter korlensis]|uniref:Alpha-amylase family protein n=1 Tax=Lysobacter korlensis TaxID=553636 RepID=A0ABV6RNT0_9GAMM